MSKSLSHSRCPIRCGRCCQDYWKAVVPASVGGFRCPHLGKNGCKLPRKDRPEECLDYFCAAATAVRNKILTPEQGVRLTKTKCNYHVYAWPKKLMSLWYSNADKLI